MPLLLHRAELRRVQLHSIEREPYSHHHRQWNRTGECGKSVETLMPRPAGVAAQHAPTTLCGDPLVCAVDSAFVTVMFAMELSTNTECKLYRMQVPYAPNQLQQKQPCCVLGWTDSVPVTHS